MRGKQIHPSCYPSPDASEIEVPNTLGRPAKMLAVAAVLDKDQRISYEFEIDRRGKISAVTLKAD